MLYHKLPVNNLTFTYVLFRRTRSQHKIISTHYRSVQRQPNIPCIDDLPFPVSVEDNVTVTPIELSVSLRSHRNSATAFHTPDLGNREIIGDCWTSSWDSSQGISLPHPLSVLPVPKCYWIETGRILHEVGKYTLSPLNWWQPSTRDCSTLLFVLMLCCHMITSQCHAALS